MNDGISKELNESITEDEIRNIVNNLSNNKAGGYDRILHEYIKSTIDQCMHIYVKFLNLVFDSGCLPECWTVGIINHCKKKVDPTNPENYRPYLSSMGKVFTAILNRRLCIISKEYNILSKNQCGFRSWHSTCDNIFILHNLISLNLAVGKHFVVVLLISERHLILFGKLIFGKNYLIIVLMENVLE